MKTLTSLLHAFLVCVSCSPKSEKENENTTVPFEPLKWQEKQDRDYPYRGAMIDDLINSKRLKKLNYKEVLNLLGEPDRKDSLYSFYMIAQKRMLAWPLHTKTMVINFRQDSTVNWVKIHE